MPFLDDVDSPEVLLEWQHLGPPYGRQRQKPPNDVLCHHTEGIPPSHTPANQLYPRSSQNPPGKRLVTNIAVIHFGFLNPSLVGMRSLSG